MKKSKKGFALGLSGVITCAILSFISFVVITILVVLLSFDKDSNTASTLTLLQYLSYASIIIALIGVCLNFKFPKISAIIMLISAILYSLVYIYLMTIGGLNNHALFIIIELVPALLFILSAISTLQSNKKNELN